MSVMQKNDLLGRQHKILAMLKKVNLRSRTYRYIIIIIYQRKTYKVTVLLDSFYSDIGKSLGLIYTSPSTTSGCQLFFQYHHHHLFPRDQTMICYDKTLSIVYVAFPCLFLPWVYNVLFLRHSCFIHLFKMQVSSSL